MAAGKFTPGFMVEEYQYTTSRNHALIGVGSGPFLMENIGEHGANLTIAVLSMNRSSLTIRLMESIAEEIPDFAGEFLVGDNGSDELERMILRRKMESMPYRCRMVEFGQNFGVAGGRNRLFREVRTEWIFSLDNDIYFIKDPLWKIQADIAQLGCHFLGMPLLNEDDRRGFILGGHLYVENVGNEVSIGGSSAYIESDISVDRLYPPFLCTFAPGGASIYRKDTFFRCGGFDEGMFVGFEDTEFSIRLFQQGYKIGACGIVSIIHDHPKPQDTGDKDYERTRFSNTKLLEAARYFEKKHGIRVWNPVVEEWVNQRLRELLDEEREQATGMSHAAGRTKILLVADKPGWALDHIAAQIIRHCSDVFEFKIAYLSDTDNLASIFFAGADCELFHFLWRSWLVDHNTEYTKGYAEQWGMDKEQFYKSCIANKTVCTSVYDHLFLEDDFEYSRRLFSDRDSIVKSYSVSSQILKEIYDRDGRIFRKPECVITDGVDLELFRPMGPDRFTARSPGRPLVLGWAGNSRWQAEKEDFKGLHTLLKPVVAELQEEGYAVELSLCDSVEKLTPHHEMPEWYAGIDVYVCPSKIEGTPNPVLECMACGVPFISTRVGIVPEASGELQSGFILKERSRRALKEKIMELCEHPEMLARLSAENLQSIQGWAWRDKARQFIPMWQKALAEKRENIQPEEAVTG